MVNLKTGKSFQDACDGIHAVDTPNSLTRRSALKGLAAILAAGVAPSLCGSITRGVGYRNLAGRMAMFSDGGGGGLLGYTTDGLVAMWDAIDNEGTGTHNPSATMWTDVTGHGHDITTLYTNGWSGGNARLASKYALGLSNELTDADVQTVSFCCNGVCLRTGYINRQFIRFSPSINKFIYTYSDRFICNRNSSYGPEIDIRNINSMTIQFINGTMGGFPLNPSWNGATSCTSYKREYITGAGTFQIGDEYYQSGKIHNVRIYNKFLTQDEITANWENDKARFNLP